MLICKDGCGTENPDTATQCQRCGRSLRSALRLHNPGTLVRHYRIKRVIGWGGFGAVYEAEDTRQSGSRVALKESFDPSGMTSFQGEFAALQQHQHAQLPRYEAMFVDQGNGYLVMEFIPGQSLEDVLDTETGPLPETQALGFALQLCEVLTYLHRQRPPILHRDLKPANVRLTPSGRIKLVDFGLFKQGTDTTQSSRMGLTPAYAPVEQHPLAPGHTDQRSDLYSLGATLYHLLTGQMPISSFDRIQTQPDPLVPPGRLNPRLSPYVAAAVSKAMSLKPDDRYPDIAAFQQALMGQQVRQQAQVHQQVQVRQQVPPPPPKPHPTPARKRSAARLMIFGGVILVTICVVVGMLRVLGGKVTPNAPATPTSVAVAPTRVLAQNAPTTAAAAASVATPLPAWVPEMVAVPAGNFLMGSTDADAKWDDEKPQHTLTLPAYESDGRIYTWGNTWEDNHANSSESNLGKTTPVGQYPTGVSPYGALDMAGNVWEWTRSVYTSYPYNPTDGRENVSGPAQKHFTLRGGSWSDDSLLRTAARAHPSPTNDDRGVGVRLARHP